MADQKFISAEWLRRFANPQGAINKAQFAALGVPVPAPPNWKEMLVGRPISAEAASAFESAAKNVRSDKPKKIDFPPDVKAELARLNAEHSAAKRKAKKERSAAKRARRRAIRKLVGPSAPKPVRQTYVQAQPRVDVTGDEFLQSYAWRQLRMKALLTHGSRCMCCGITPAHGAVMNVDHIKPRRLFPALALELSNLQILCHECNHGKGNWDQTDWRRALHERDDPAPEDLRHIQAILAE